MTELYNGSVAARLNEGSHRYTISADEGQTWGYKPGVTSIIGATLAKPSLMLWPLDEALKYLFGQEFTEVLQDDGSISVKPTYNASKAFLKANRPLTQNELQDGLEMARMAHTLKRDKGGDTGKITHTLVEGFLLAQLSNPDRLPVFEHQVNDKQAWKAFTAFKEWYINQADIKPVKVEQLVYSKQHDFAGTFDCLLEIDGKRILCDVKTSNYSRTAPLGIYAENFLQLGAYSLAYAEEAGKAVDDLMVINASKQGKLNTLKASQLGMSVQDCEAAWLNTFRLYQIKDSLQKQLSKIKETINV